MDIPRWVQEAPAGERDFRRTVHCVLDGVANDPRLRELLCMKGGILMALHYESPRFTTDIDFSTPQTFDEELEKEVVQRMKEALGSTPERLGYDIDCRLQSHKVEPNRTKTFVNIKMKVGYAQKDTPQHRRLMAGQSPSVLSIDYSFKETVPGVEVVEIGDDESLRVYALSTLVAEKLRSLLQQPIRNRNRRQDVFDLNFLMDERPELLVKECMTAVLSDLIVKCADRNIAPSRETFDDPKIREMAEADYNTLSDELPPGHLPPFEPSFQRVADYYRSLPWGQAEEGASAKIVTADAK